MVNVAGPPGKVGVGAFDANSAAICDEQVWNEAE